MPKTVSDASPPPLNSRRTVTPPWPCVTSLPAARVILIAAAESGFRRISLMFRAPGLSARGSQPRSAVAASDQPLANGKCQRVFRLRKSASECCRCPV